jgi:PAS domain S-box-containing protein
MTLGVGLVLGAILCAGVGLRLANLRRLMMDGWQRSLEGGAVTTQQTLDEWYLERVADAEQLAASVTLPGSSGSEPTARERGAFGQLFSPIARRGQFVAGWVIDRSGRPIAGFTDDTLYDTERDAVRRAIAHGRTTHSDLVPHAAVGSALSFASPVRAAAAGARSASAPGAVLLRADAIAAFGPWAQRRPNAALSMFVAPAKHGTVIVVACPGRKSPVCITQHDALPAGTPPALALARVDSFGVFRGIDGEEMLAVTRFDTTLQWGIVRRIARVDAAAPFRKELAIESAFLAVIVALFGVAAFAANREVRVRRLREQAQADARLATVVDTSRDGLVSLDEHFRITMVNSAVERLFGQSREALVGRPVVELFALEWRSYLARCLTSFARSGAEHAPLADSDRCLARRPDGELFPVDATLGRALLDGSPLFTLGVHDISDRARAEMFMHGQRQVLELIASGAPAPEALTALLNVVEIESPAMRCAAYELEEDGVMLRLVCAPRLPVGFTESTDEIVVGPVSAAVGTAMFRGEPVYSTDIATDPLWEDSYMYVLPYGLRAGWAMPLRAADGSLIGALACYYDEARGPTMRELELASAAVHLASIALSTARDASSLRSSEASFRSFVENAPAAIYRETRRGHVVSTNPAMVRLLGYQDSDALVQAADGGLLYRDVSTRSRLLAALEAHDVVRGEELEWRRSDGTFVTVRLSARAYRDDRGEVWLWEGFAEDVTPLRAAEHALRRSEKLAAVGQLISGVAHELNNPLSSIMHFAEDLLADERTPEDAEALVVIRDQARRSRAIVRDLLSFVQQREVHAERLALAEVVVATARAMRPAAEESGVRLQVAAGGEGSVLADRNGVEQIVTNLVGNALQAAGEGGEVWVRTEADAVSCRLIVEDTGPGIAPDVLPQIFDPFFTTKPIGEGTGLGLSVTLGIVEQLGGRIAVEPRDAVLPGTRFTVTLPLAAPGALPRRWETPARPAAAARAPLMPPASPSVISSPVAAALPASRVALVIDDEPSIRAALRRYFARRGWLVEEAEDGAAAMSLIESHGERFRVVISDLRMPGFSGMELHDRLARERPALLRRVMFSTGDVASPDAASFVQRTACPVLQKPFELRMLDEVIARLDDGATVESAV